MISFHYRHANLFLGLGFALLALNVVVLMSGGGVAGLSSGVLFVAVGLLHKNVPLVTIDGDTIAFRKAPLRSKTLHSLREVQEVGPVIEKTIGVQTADASFEIPVGALSEQDRSHLLSYLTQLTRPIPVRLPPPSDPSRPQA